MAASVEVAQTASQDDCFDKLEAHVDGVTTETKCDKKLSNSYDKQSEVSETNKMSEEDWSLISKSTDDGQIETKVEKPNPSESGDSENPDSSVAEEKWEEISSGKDAKLLLRADNNNKSLSVAKRDPGANGPISKNQKTAITTVKTPVTSNSNTKVFDGKNFVEAPIPAMNAWTKKPHAGTPANRPAKDSAPKLEAAKESGVGKTETSIKSDNSVRSSKQEHGEAVKAQTSENQSDLKASMPKKDQKVVDAAAVSTPHLDKPTPSTAVSASGPKGKPATEPSKAKPVDPSAVKSELGSPSHAKSGKPDSKTKKKKVPTATLR